MILLNLPRVVQAVCNPPFCLKGCGKPEANGRCFPCSIDPEMTGVSSRKFEIILDFINVLR